MPHGNTTLNDTHIGLAHGNGGRYMRELIEAVFRRHLADPNVPGELDTEADAVLLGDIDGPIYTTVDGFAVHPLEFPGGDIGSLAVHGTVNDLSVAGAIPRYLTLSAFLEEGLEVEILERVVASMARAATAAGVRIVAGDTKVLPRGHGGGIYFSVSGIGVVDAGLDLGIGNIHPGDVILVSGTVGDHGTAVMLAREAFGLHGDVRSDSASVFPLAHALTGLAGVRFLRDPTRGGLATVAHEISRASGLRVELDQAAIPVRDEVGSVCEILGYDPLYLACEGRCVAVVAAERAEQVLTRWQALDAGRDAAVIGRIGEAAGETFGEVVLNTPIGGQRRLEELEDDPLPRIC